LSALEDRGLAVWGKVVVTGSPEVLVVAGLQQQRKNHSPQPGCSGDDNRISDEHLSLDNEIREATAMFEKENSPEQSKPICEDKFSVRKNVKRKLFKRTRMPKENRSIKTIGEELLEEYKKDNYNEKQLKLEEKKLELEAAKFKFEVEKYKLENPTFLFNVDLSF
jgi:hypothetical protein